MKAGGSRLVCFRFGAHLGFNRAVYPYNNLIGWGFLILLIGSNHYGILIRG